MKAPIRGFLVFAAFVCVFASKDLCAQWKNIAPNLLKSYIGVYANPSLGAIHFKDGILWAGWKDLWSSNDSGITWQKNSFDLQGNIISDINFYDKLNGIISTNNDEFSPSVSEGVFLTRDGGKTWKQILPVLHCSQVAFDGSPNIIHSLTQGDFPAPTGFFYTTINGGVTWNPTWPGGDYSQCFTIAKDNVIYVLNGGNSTAGLPGFTSASTDLGTTWRQSPTEVDGDSYTICADSCDPKKLYVANEDYTVSVNNLSELLYSKDAGNTWVSAVGFARPYLSGGMACTVNDVYASSLRDGIYRSTDQGISWKKIGGPPSMAFDSRNITCVNDSVIFVLDDQGSIWETTNSGGVYQATGILFSANSLFSGDSLIVCDTSVSRFIHIQEIGCTAPTLIKIDLLGADSLSYATIPLAGDSIGVQFLPLFDSLNDAQLLLTLSDGNQKVVPLTGFGIPRAPLVLMTQDQTVDTLGGSTLVPIILNGLYRPEDITLIVHYDTVLNYNGSFSLSSTKLDLPGEQWKGRSKLKIIGAIPNSTLGYSFFDVFNDSVPIQHVTFDSVTVLSAINVCQYISSVAATSTVTPLTGCGVASISKFLHYGRLPDLRIVPNPASGEASITSSMNLGEVTVSIYDMLGAEKSSAAFTLSQNTPAKLPLPASNGIYEVRVMSISGIFNLRVVVNR